jgi:hypothetical protein
MNHYQKSLKGAAANREKALKRYYADPALCLNCGKVIDVGPTERPSVVKKTRKFCSQSCSATYTNSRKPKREAVKTGNCERCGTQIRFRERRRSYKGSVKQGYVRVRFCNDFRVVAQHETQLENNKKKGVLTWDLVSKMTKKELLDHYNGSPYWFKVRSTSHAQTLWRRAKRPNICQVCGFEHINICHIKDVREFDGNALMGEINSPDNLVGLCPNHHWLLDRKKLNLSDINKKTAAQ